MKTKKVTIVDVLKRALKILSNRGSWTKEVGARNKANESVSSYDPNACKFCAIGAVYRAAHELGVNSALMGDDVIDFCEEFLPVNFVSVHEFNDAQKTKRPVLNLFKRAIAKGSK